jgi:biopolymer transport protein ExbD
MKRRFSLANESSDASHGDRPWVFFMVDCFFLITEFFVLTFKFKAEEFLLPQQLPPGGGPGRPPVTATHSIGVHVASGQNGGGYLVMGEPATAAKLEEVLAASSLQLKDRVSVRVSYDASVPWCDVMAVFNACTKVRIAECGLVPLRVSDSKAAQ